MAFKNSDISRARRTSIANKTSEHFQQLEARQLLAASPFLESTGRLVVLGTAGNDTIVISKDPKNAARILASVNGVVTGFNNAHVKNVRVDGGNGADVIRTDESTGALSQPMFFLGGGGNDTLISTAGGDCLIGAYGNDVIIAATGSNWIDAGPGADKVFSGAGNDTVVGAAAGDYVSDAGGVNSIVAPGATVIKAAIPATIAGVPQWKGTTTVTPTPTPIPPTPAPVTPPVAVPATGNTANNGNTKFIIGVWAQPHYSFAKWKARGVNTTMYYSQTTDLETYSKAALDNGLMMIRQPNWSNLAADKKWTNLIGYIQGDEPDYRGIPASQLAADYAKMKAAYPSMPVVVNFNGAGPLWGYSTVTQAGYKEYLKTADWISQDLYPMNGHNRPNALDAPGQAAALLSQWSGGKRQITILEASDMEATGVPAHYPGVTADQFRAQVWNAVISGSTGIVYFPQRIGGAGFLWENMTPAVEAEMKTTNARLTRIGDAIMAPMNPVGVNATASSGLRVTWRKYGGKTYMIALNNTNTTIAAGKITATGITANTTATVDSENRTIAVKGGVITDSFKPYEAHVYLVG